MAATAKKMTYEFTTDDDELNDDGTKDQASMCNIYKLNLPASASILSKQIAKSQAKRAKKEEKHRRRVDLSTVREQDETKLSASEENASPLPSRLDDVPSAPASHFGGRSRIDSAPPEVKLKRQDSLPDERKAEPMDEEEAQLLAMLLSGIEHNRKYSNRLASENTPNLQNLPTMHMSQMGQTLPSPGLPRMPPSAKVSEWLLERSTSPDNVSVVSSVLLEDSGLILTYQNEGEDEDDEDVFFDASDDVDQQQEQKTRKSSANDDVVKCVEHEMQGLSLNRNMSAMTNSLVRVEEETTTDGGLHEILGTKRTGRSTSVSPRPTNEQFVRNANGSATFNVKHSSTMSRTPKVSPVMLNGNMSMSHHMTSTPLSSRTTRSVLRVHNVNSVSSNKKSPQFPMQSTISMSKSTTAPSAANTNNRVYSNRQPEPVKHTPPTVTIAPSTPSRPASVASSTANRSTISAAGGSPMSNLAGLQDLIQMQEEALRKAALNGQTPERKMSWHSDQDANRQSTSTHSSLGSLCSSKSIDGAHALSKLGNSVSRIPTPRSRLPTPRTSTLSKRVSIGVQTDIPWPPPRVFQHRSQSLPCLTLPQLQQQQRTMLSTSASEYANRFPKTGRRMVRSLLVSP